MTNLTATDPRPRFERAVGVADQLVRSVRPEQLDDPTPCDDMPVGALIAHLVSVVERVATIGRGEPIGFGGEPPALAHDEIVPAWERAVADWRGAWADDAALERPVALPWQQGSAAEVLAASYVPELLVHEWDLARATGQHPTWDDDDVAAALEGYRSILPANRAEAFAAARAVMPPEMQGFSDPFGAVVEVPPTAPLIDQLAAWSGRQP